jgi:hypothetical protein
MHAIDTKTRVMIAICTAVALSFVALPRASANIGPEWYGDLALEPTGLRGVAISREKLTIDLRPLIAVEPVHVEAIYQLHNPGSTKHLKLVFVAGQAGVSDFQVRLGNQSVEAVPVPQEELANHWREFPESWLSRQPMPGIDLPDPYVRVRDTTELSLLRFAIELPPGSHVLTARYRAKVSGADEGYPTATWQLPYVLAPAREWGSFEGLDVTVYLPDGWQSASTPLLERDGSVLRGTFTGLPADVLILAARAPAGPELRHAIVLYGCLYIVAVIGGGVLCWGLGRSLGRLLARSDRMANRASRGFDVRVVLPSLLLAGLWGAVILIAWNVTRTSIIRSLAGQESPYFHERFFAPTCFTLVMFVVCLPLGVLIAWRSAIRPLTRPDHLHLNR